MRGVVEIIQDGVRVYESDNLIVDGASELLTDIMTVTPSLSKIPSASALLDASNYTIRAASFGKDSLSYNTNCHSSSILQLSSIYNSSLRRYEFTVINTSGSSSSFIPVNGLPTYPDPLDTRLQHIPSSLLPFISDYGQNLNIFGLWKRGLSSLPLFSSLNVSTAALFGCYPESELLTARTRVLLKDSSGINVIASGGVTDFNSAVTFNSASGIDWRGYIKKDSDSFKGLALQLNAAAVSSLGKITNQIKLAAAENRILNLYGGISTMGLWYIDIPATIKNGGVFPLQNDDVLQPKIIYKLFAKKIFNNNICRAFDTGVNAGLLNSTIIEINWSIYFI